MPFTPVTDTWSTSTIADLCGISGVGDGVGGRECNLFEPGTIGAPGIVPSYYEFAPGATDYKIDWNNVAPNVGRRVAAERTGRLAAPPARRSRAGDDPRRLHEDATAWSAWTGSRMPTATIPAAPWPRRATTPPASRWYCPVNPRPSCCVTATGSGPRHSPPHRSIRWRPRSATTSTSSIAGHPGSLGAPVLARVPALARPQHGVRGSLRREPQREGVDDREPQREGPLRERLPERVQGGPGEPARERSRRDAAARSPTSARAAGRLPSRPISPTSAGSARRGRAIRRPTRATSFSNSAWTGHLGQYEPDPIDAADDLHANTTFRQNAINAGLPANFFVMNPSITNANIVRAADRTQYDSLQLDFRRRFVGGLLLGANYTYAHKARDRPAELCGPIASSWTRRMCRTRSR